MPPSLHNLSHGRFSPSGSNSYTGLILFPINIRTRPLSLFFEKMAMNSTKTTSTTLEDSISDNKANHAEQGEEVEIEDEEEALSLSDLPISLVHMEGHDRSPKHEDKQGDCNFDFDFNIGPPRRPISSEPDMCAADDVFFMGQILPLRLSSSDGVPTRFPFRASCLSRSGSLEFGSSGGSTTATSSRSSSTRSHNSSSTSSTYGAPAALEANTGPVKVRNPFHAHPSPRPQIRIHPGRTRTHSSGGRARRSTMWDIFRLGPVRTPEIELRDLKFRGQNGNFRSSSKGGLVSRNSSRNSDGSSSCSGKVISANGEIDGGRKSVDRKRGFLGSCKCSAGAVEVPSRIVISGTNDVAKGGRRDRKAGLEGGATKQENRPETRRQSVSRHRTFEWLKELSHATAALDDP